MKMLGDLFFAAAVAAVTLGACADAALPDGWLNTCPVPPKAVRNVVKPGAPSERAVFIGGAYCGQAIDRTLFSFSPRRHDIVIEPPVNSVRQPCLCDGVRSGHYIESVVPTGEAEVIVPEDFFDGKPHLRILPCKVLPVEPGRLPEIDTVTPEMSGPEIDGRRLVRLQFDLTGCADLLLDKVGIAVYWTSDAEGAAWKGGRGQLSVFSKYTRDALRESGAAFANGWKIEHGGAFPQDGALPVGLDDECFNLTSMLDGRACSLPLWGFSPGGRAAFAAAAPGLVQPRTWGFPEIYGEEAYGRAFYAYHKASVDMTNAFEEGVRSVSPSLKVRRVAAESSAETQGAAPGEKPKATLAVLRSFTKRAICSARGSARTGWRNPADKMLSAYALAWSADNGMSYDVFELPPSQTDDEKKALAEELKEYPHVVSTVPWPGARVVGADTEGSVLRADDFVALRKRFAAEIAELMAEEAARASIFNVRDFGAKGDGVAKDTAAVQQAVDAANAAGGGEVLLPKGTYLCGSVFLKSGVDFHLAEGATLKGSPDPADYNAVDVAPQNSGRLGAGDNTSGGHLLLCIEQKNVTLRGPGKIDGSAGAFLRKPDGSHPKTKLEIPWRPSQMVWFVESQNIAIRDIELADAPYWSCFVYGCEDVTVERAYIHTIRNPHTYNGDGLDIDSSRRVRVTDCDISTADDSLTLRADGARLKAAKDGLPDCADVVVSNCTFSSDCNAIRLGVGNGRIRDCSFSGIRIVNTRYAVNAVGAWSRPEHGVDISNVTFEDVKLDAKGFCKFYYKHATHSVFDGITFRHVRGRVREPSIFDDKPDRPFRNLRFEDVRLNGETSPRVR